MFIPDIQAKPGVPLSHVGWAGQYAAEKRPDVIIQAGDWYDLPSLSSYDVLDRPGDYYGRQYEADLDAGDASVLLFHESLSGSKGYKPRRVYLVGNHEERFIRLIQAQPKLKGAIRAPWAYAESLGWEVHPFLKVVKIDGIAYAHYFCRGPNGMVVNNKKGQSSAKIQVVREMMSCTAGHKQGLDVHVQPSGCGIKRGVIAGSFYQHEEYYMGPQGNDYWRGILMKHEVKNGDYNLMEVSLDYLARKYGGKK